tara:strand:- start:663 stop:1109 length:447 start_codon:yes stop_codon:yes gene_type:complete
VAKPELGNKHTCQECGVKFYDLNKQDVACPACGTAVLLITEESQIQIKASKVAAVQEVVENVTDTETNEEKLDNSAESGVIEDDNPIIMDDDDILDDESEEELINENDIDIPDIENEELIEDDDNDFLVEEDDIEESDLIITPKSDEE